MADQLVSPNFTGPAGKGPDGFKAMILPLRQGFPDLHFTIQDMLVEGSQLVVAGIGGNPSRSLRGRRADRTPGFQ